MNRIKLYRNRYVFLLFLVAGIIILAAVKGVLMKYLGSFIEHDYHQLIGRVYNSTFAVFVIVLFLKRKRFLSESKGK